MTAFIARPPVFYVLCAPGSPWSSRWRSCIERTRVASAAPWSSYRTAWYCCCRSRPLCPPSLAFGVSRHPSQASNRVGQRSCRRGSDGETSGTASTDVTSSSPNSGLSLKLRLFRMDPKQLIFKKLLRGCEKKSAGYGIQVCLCKFVAPTARRGRALRTAV